MNNINERLDNLKLEIQKPEFLEGKGLSNEVNIRIFCYDAQDEMIVRHFTEQLIVDQSLDCHLIERNLYKVFLSICDDKRITEKAVQMEEQVRECARLLEQRITRGLTDEQRAQFLHTAACMAENLRE